MSRCVKWLFLCMLKISDLLYNKLQIKYNKVIIGRNLTIMGKCVFSTEKKESISIGNNCKIISSIFYNKIGGDLRCVIRTIQQGEIMIGNNVQMSNCTIISRKKVIIEDNAMIGGGVKLYDNDFHSTNSQERIHGDLNIKSKMIIIKKNSFIGAHSILLKGAIVGENSVLGAGSVLAAEIPPNEIWAGNPARFIRKV